jgi:ABC-type transport system substrate-binding protein
MSQRIAVVLLFIVLCPVAVAAAPEGKVVIAQGVDPTTLDMTNQQEQPASNVGAQMFESLLERDQSLKLVPALAAEMPKLVAPTTWEFKPVRQDLAKTKKLLTEAGFPNGLEIVLNGPQGRYVRDREVAEAVAGQLTKAGIKTTLCTHEFVSYLNNMVYVHKAGPVWLIG